MRALLTVTAALLAACGGPSAHTDFDIFWTDFTNAVGRDSRAGVRDLTRFPVLFDGNEQNRDDFATVYEALFDDDARACLAKATPLLEDARYIASCGPVLYVFENGDDGWRFAEFAADPEALTWTADLVAAPGEELGAWRLVAARWAPWAPNPEGDPGDSRLRGSTIHFTSIAVLAAAPLGCDNASFDNVVTPAEGLFQGGLSDPAEASARAVGVRHLPVLTTRVRCDSGMFDYHRIGGDTLLVALDHVIWTLAPIERQSTPAGLVIRLLADHMTQDMEFSQARFAARSQYFTPDLNARVADYFRHPWPADEPPPISGDPITDSQEYPTRFALGDVVTTGDSAVVPVVFVDGNRQRSVDVRLRSTGGRWLVDDLFYQDGSTFRQSLLERPS